MSEFINMQVYGVPIATYGLVGLTTAVLAYATAISGGGEVISEAMKSLPNITESPMTALSNMNPLSPSTESTEKSPESKDVLEGLNPFMGSDQPTNEPSDEPPDESSDKPTTGGKKRRRKTPKSKKSKRRGKSHKNRK
jgi:hypothetical protein